MCRCACPSPRFARVYFASTLLVSLVLLGGSAWEVLIGNRAVYYQEACGFPLAPAMQLQGGVNLGVAAALALSSLLFLGLECIGITCCSAFFGALVHLGALAVYFAVNAWMSIIVFSDARWVLSDTPTFNCAFYRPTAAYVMALWAAPFILPALFGVVVHCLCGCLVDEALEEHAAKHRRCRLGGRGEPAEEPLVGALVPKRD